MIKKKGMANRKVERPRRELTGQIYRGNRFLFFLSVLFLTAVNGMNVVMSHISKMFMDVITGDSTLPLFTVVLYAAAALGVYAVAGIANAVTGAALTRRSMRQYKAFVFSKLTDKSISSFSNENTARYISTLTNDAAQVESGYIVGNSALVCSVLCFLAALGSSLYYSPVLTLVSLGSAALPLLTGSVGGNVIEKAQKRVSDRNELFVGSLKDWLSGFSVIKSFKAENPVFQVFQKENRALEQEKYERAKKTGFVQTAADIISYSSGILLYVCGIILILLGAKFTVGTLIAIASLKNSFNWPMILIPMLWSDRKAAIGLIDKQASLLAENVRREGEKIPAKLTDGITFEGVSFAYEEGKPVLQNVSQRFEAGKSYAIVGASGSGKSTLLNLLLGSTDSYEGKINFDGKELRGIDEDSLYELMTPVQQNVFVFNDTIRNNVTMFKDFPDVQVERAIRLSGLSKLIEERGKDYVCGENGNGLSGGERQRISIARAILRGAPVLLVDEATAALDAETAYVVSNAILDIQGLTRIVVTHRLEAALLARYDEILVMCDGEICEAGSFTELMEAKGMFHSLYEVSQCA